MGDGMDRRTLLGWGASGLAGSVLAGRPAWAEAAWDETVAAARKEGRVSFYTVAGLRTVSRIATAFSKAYPDIAIDTFRGTTGPVGAKVDQEMATGADGADVYASVDFVWLRKQVGESRALKPCGPAVRGWPSRYLIEGAVPTVGIEPFALVYNKRRVTTPPQSYADILKPEFNGRIGTTEVVGPATTAFYSWLEEAYDKGYLTKLRALRPRLFNGTEPIAQATGSGEIWIGVYNTTLVARSAIEQGAPIGYVAASRGVPYGAIALGWSHRPNAALVLLDFLMSVPGQEAWHGLGLSASPLPGVPGAIPIADVSAYKPEDFPPEVVTRYRERFASIFR